MIDPNAPAYLPDGQEVSVVSEVPGRGYVVVPVYEVTEEGPVEGDPMFAPQVFSAAPTQKIDKDVANARNVLADLNQKIRETRDAAAASAKEMEAAKARAASVPALRQLFDFIDGKLTHYAERRYGAQYSVFAFKDAKSGDGTESPDRSRGEFKLLSLFGDTKGDLAWRLNYYRDGSGSYSDVIPCTSEEQAMDVVRGWMDEDVAAFRTKGTIPSSYSFDSAAKLKLSYPTDIMIALHTRALVSLDSSDAAAAVGDEERRASRAALESKIAALNSTQPPRTDAGDRTTAQSTGG